MMAPKVGIIYLSFYTQASRQDITRCFRSLMSVDYPREALEVICVDNRSPYGKSAPFIKEEWLPLSGKEFPKLTLLEDVEDSGFAGGNNAGLTAAIASGCDYVFLLNQDCDVEPLFIRKAVDRAERDPKVGYVQSLVLLGKERDRVNTVGNRYHYLGYGYCGGYRWTVAEAEAHFARERQANPDLEIATFSGAAALARVSMLREIGLFDAKFHLYHEDVDASLNARMRGWKTVVEPSSIVHHHYQFAKSIKKFFWMERNRFVVLYIYYKIPTLLLIALPLFAVELASMIFAARGGWWKEKLRAWAFFWRPASWRWIATRRRQAQATRIISDRELLKWADSRILFQEGDVSGTLVTKIANPVMTFVWKILYSLIIW